jgi:uncharacterized membrane protein
MRSGRARAWVRFAVVAGATTTFAPAPWASAASFFGLGDLAGGSVHSRATDVSNDGSVVVGQGESATAYLAVRWTEANGMVSLGDLPGGITESGAGGVSSDGSVVVGGTSSASGWEGFRWTEAGGVVGLGDLPGGEFISHANDVSGDGSLVVGRGHTDLGWEAFIWDEARGMVLLQEVLVNDYGLDLTGWTLTSASAISDDGLVIVGEGYSQSGVEAWIAVIPEPNTALLVATGLLGLAYRQRRHGRASQAGPVAR